MLNSPPGGHLGPLYAGFFDQVFGMIVERMDVLRQKPHERFQVAMDGSGSVHADPFVTFGVVAGLPAAWEAFSREWYVFLGQKGLPHFSMKEAMGWDGPFMAKKREWGTSCEEMRDRLVLRAAQIIATHLTVCGFSRDLRRIKPPSESKKRHVAAQKDMFMFVVRKLLAITPDDFVLFFMSDDDQGFAKECYDLVRGLKLKDPGLAPRIGAMCFGDDRVVPHIQASDLVAYAFRHRRLGTPGLMLDLQMPLFPWVGTEQEETRFNVAEPLDSVSVLIGDDFGRPYPQAVQARMEALGRQYD